MDCARCKSRFSSILIVLAILTLVSNIDCNCEHWNLTSANMSGLHYPLPNFNISTLCGLHFQCSENDPKSIYAPPELFRPFKQLRILQISNCNLGSVDENVLYGLGTLEILEFTNVHNLPISANKFRHSPNLKVLKVQNSDWYGVSPNSLCMLTKIHTLKLPGNQVRKTSEIFELCSRNQSFFSQVTKLNLEFNLIEILESNFSQRMANLEILSLKGNKIREIQIGALANLSQLRSLDISENNLTQLPDDFLSDCPLVKTLILSNNLISKLPSSIGELKNLEIFEAHNTFINDINSLNGKFLRKVDVHNSSLTLIPTTLCRNNPNLESLDLGRNYISTVPQNIFKNCKKLEQLVLSSNNILILFNESLNGLENLTLLDLSNNNISSFGEETVMSMTYLDRLNLSFNSLIEIPLIPSNVSYLDVSYNKITNIQRKLYNVKSLTHFYAPHNLISRLQPNTLPQSLVHINLANNLIQRVNFAFKNLKELKAVNLQMNKMVSFSKPKLPVNSKIEREFYISGNQFKCDCRLAWMKEIIMSPNVSNPLIFVDQKNITCFKHGKDWLPEGLLHENGVNAFVCRYFEMCPKDCLCKHTHNDKVNDVDCKNRNITSLTGISSNAKWIDLSGNNLGSLSNRYFINQTKAEILYLNNSKITTIAERTFTTFNSLTELHLENNEIRMLYKDSFFGLSKLKRLYLDNNAIEGILPGTFSVTPKLEYLDLSSNDLKKIDSQTFIVKSLQTIILSWNPWSCNCDDMKYMQELLDNRPSLIDSKSILCDNSNKTVVEYYKGCYPKINTIHFYGVIIGLALIVVVSITGTLLYVYRFEIQLLFFVRFGWRLVLKRNRLDEEDKMYDAFMSYHSSLDDFVVNEMLPRLEGTNPAYKLCIHIRDFPAGAAIVDNITDSIANSKRTIVLLNDQFLSSEWCKYEFQAAHYEALSNKLNTLIVVLLEDINPDLLYGGLKLYMKTRTYLRYDDPRFWDRLRFALPDIKEENPNHQETSL